MFKPVKDAIICASFSQLKKTNYGKSVITCEPSFPRVRQVIENQNLFVEL